MTRSLCGAWLLVLATASSLLAEEPARREWTIDGVAREGLVYVPPKAKSEPTPVVFAFHGHGGRAAATARTFSVHTHWPEAIAVYLQGLNTPGRLTDPEGKRPGWQHSVGNMEDRDLKFFDAVLASLRKDYKVDDARIYSTGHSNGGGFTYLLWAARGDQFAAVAPSGAAAAQSRELLKPKPVMHLGGETDPLVRFAWQQATIDFVRKLNECGEGQPWDGDKLCTLYPSKLNTPVVTYIHPGGHQFTSEAMPLVVKFFKEHAKPSNDGAAASPSASKSGN